jgi:hypothetical protein
MFLSVVRLQDGVQGGPMVWKLLRKVELCHSEVVTLLKGSAFAESFFGRRANRVRMRICMANWFSRWLIAATV